MIDSHCHLADKQFAEDLPQVLERAKAAGVEYCMAIVDSLPEAEKCLELAEKYEHIFCTVGIHPHVSTDWSEESGTRLKELVGRSLKVRAIGEIGLDFHYDFSPRETQREVFAAQLVLAKELRLPAVVHCREAIAEVRPMILASGVRAVLHCCTEAWEDVQPLVAAGHVLSFTGIATYPKSDVIRRTLRECPIEQMMIETDAPYLAPVPHRGKRNEPAFVAEVLACVAREKGIALGEAERITTRNTVEFFGLPA